MASFFTSYFLPLVLVANIFNFQTSLCDTSADEALIAGICRQVQDPPFCLNTFRQILAHPYVPEEVTRAAIAQSLQNANNNRAFIEAAKAAAKDKETQDLYAICDSSYGLLITVLQDAAKSLANKDYNGLENDLSKCPKFVSDCQNVLGSKTTPEMLDRSRKQFDLIIMSKAAEGLIKK
ncbi:hypothetical protein MTR67_047246 [Solanum verrucosum]|uniref:Pectinesterase inhibitor domain-containing protein n=1 Tax=Solanum verrucosum TaxID=315347 RepID=A0AAF0UZG5_SOLVR|nr:uncharacterized protein LOC125835703 [Solanum verrucosum]KAH0745650.1 hypothetical protein KY285_007307 [Solanum tuberosum]WMV53861.1 hypothetical protein MTR67_047246 [Solanum verrucosum]